MEHPVKSTKANPVTDVTDPFDINVTRARACRDNEGIRHIRHT